MSDFVKCHFCEHEDTVCGCDFCEHYSDFKPDKHKIFEEAKGLGISVCDLITLIQL